MLSKVAVERMSFLQLCVKLCLIVVSSASCPSGWTSRSHGCYFGNTSTYTSSAMQEVCKSLHAEALLPTVRSHGETLEVLERMGNSKAAFLNIFDEENEGTFRMKESSGSSCKISYSNWQENQPDDSGFLGSDYVELLNSKDFNIGKWNDSESTMEHELLCQIPKWKPCSPCPSGWEAGNYGCYYSNTSKYKPTEMLTKCQTLNANALLPSVRTDEETLEVLGFMKSINMAWINVNDTKTEGTFMMVNSAGASCKTTYLKWMSGQPNNYANSDYVLIYKTNTSAETGKWNDNVVAATTKLFCQIPFKQPCGG